MSDTGIFWIRDDFRLENNPALSFATQNHESVIALFIYNNKNFDNQTEAQKWWVSKSLEIFKKDLSRYNINLQIVKGDELSIFSKIKKKDNFNTWKHLSMSLVGNYLSQNDDIMNNINGISFNPHLYNSVVKIWSKTNDYKSNLTEFKSIESLKYLEPIYKIHNVEY